jgi:branched-chain amino acid transport system substrate-binding protein
MIENGGKTWFFITVDHAFGVALQTETTKVVEASGGKVLGAARHPIGALDFASYLLAAQSSGAEVIGLASVGGDLINAIKQASEFGLGVKSGQQLATFLTYITDIHALGLPVTQGLTFASSFYWDQNDEAREFATRFANERNGAMPTKNQAAIYAASIHFLKAVSEVGNTDPLAVNDAMRRMPVSYFGRPASVRSDGRVMFDLALYRVKKPEQSKGPWDVYGQVRDIPQAEAFLPVNLAACAHT